MSAPDPGDQPRRRRKRRRRKSEEGTIAILDRLLMRPRSMALNGERIQVPTIEVIILQLLQKEMAGDLRARRALLKYEEFANRRRERKFNVRFVESDYTRSIASGEQDGHG